MAQKTAINPQLLYNDSNHAPSIEERLVDGAATWYAGQFLYDKNDGLIYTCASDSVALKYLAIQDHATADTSESTYYRMMRTHDDDVYQINIYHSTAGSATATEAMVGIRYGLYVAANVCWLDKEEVTADAFEVVEPSWRNSAYMNTSADTYANALVKILSAVVHAEPA